MSLAKTKLRHGISQLVFLLITSTSLAQTPFRFEHLIVGNQNNATIAAFDMHRDSLGFVWLATYRGLARFDGNAMKLIEFKKPGGVDYGRLEINSIVPWGSKYLILSTARKGVFLYHKPDGDFRVFDERNGLLRNNGVLSMALDSRDRLWVAHATGMDQIDLRTYKSEPCSAYPVPYLSKLAFAPDGILWAASPYGMVRVSKAPDGKEVYRLYREFGNGEPADVKDFQFAPKGLWMITRSGNLYLLSKGSLEVMKTFRAGSGNIPHTEMSCVYTDNRERLWLGTRNGLGLLDPETDSFIVYRNKPGDAGSLSGNHVQRIYDDRRGQVYMLCNNSIDFVTDHTKPIQILWNALLDSTSILKGDPFCGFRDSRGTLWAGTAGLAYQKKNGEKAFLHSSEGTWKGDYVLDIIETADGNLFFTSSNGLVRLRPENYNDLLFENYPFKDRNFQGEGSASFLITDLCWDGKDILWMSTSNGISRFHIADGRFESFRDEDPAMQAVGGNQMNTILLDRKGNVWIGTRSNGLRMLPASAPFQGESLIRIHNDPTSGHSLSNDAIHDIFEDSEGRIWVATGYGLNLLETIPSASDTTFRFRRFGKEIGWQTEVFSSVNQDREGIFWIGTLGGLYRFDLEDMAVRHFVLPDGMPSDAIVTDGIEKGKDGRFYVACRNGLAWFDPIVLSKSVAPPSKPVLTGLSLFHKEVPTRVMSESTTTFSLDEDISTTERIRLQHHQNVLTIGFTGLDVLNVPKQRYSYRLLGFDDQWQDAGYVNSATFTNLSPGKYTFEARVQNGDGIWSTDLARLLIIITPPWYQTWWAYLLFALAAAVGIWIFIRSRIAIYRREMDIRLESEKAISKARMEERELMRQKNARDFHDETGIKLTRINLLTTTALQKSKDEVVTDCLNQIENNARDLTSSMRDFVWALDPNKDSLSSILQRIQDLGNKQFDYTDTQFSSGSSFMEWQETELDFDEKLQVLMIFKEAMNNAIKYAQASHVVLKCTPFENGIQICLSDDGVGFDPNGERESFGLKNMAQRAQRIGGRLTVRSSPGSGTDIILFMKKTF